MFLILRRRMGPRVCVSLMLFACGCAGGRPTWQDASGPEGAELKGHSPGANSDGLLAPLYGVADKRCGGAEGVGGPVQDFDLPVADGSGSRLSPAQSRGRVLLLNFWGTWCKPCLKELPEFERLQRSYGDLGLSVVAVATDEEVEGVHEFVQDHDLTMGIAYQGEGAAGAYGIRTFPFSFVVDHEGVIRAAYDGYKEGCMGSLESDIRAQLGRLAAS